MSVIDSCYTDFEKETIEPPNVGCLNAHEVVALQQKCLTTYKQNGLRVSTFLNVTMVITAISLYMVGCQLINILITCAYPKIILLGVYFICRNQDLINAEKALDDPKFKNFLVQNKFTLSSATICQIAKIYKNRFNNN